MCLYPYMYVSFQSTPPVKAATRKALMPDGGAVFQSTPPVKAATLHHRQHLCGGLISIHAAREGGDAILGMSAKAKYIFQSTPPVKAATFLPIKALFV